MGKLHRFLIFLVGLVMAMGIFFSHKAAGQEWNPATTAAMFVLLMGIAAVCAFADVITERCSKNSEWASLALISLVVIAACSLQAIGNGESPLSGALQALLVLAIGMVATVVVNIVLGLIILGGEWLWKKCSLKRKSSRHS